jgi:hypothetical protein
MGKAGGGVKPMRRIKEANAKSETAAKLITRIGMKVSVRKDDGFSMVTVTTSAPWQLGHGAWVVKVDGVSGGYDCARVSPVESVIAA